MSTRVGSYRLGLRLVPSLSHPKLPCIVKVSLSPTLSLAARDSCITSAKQKTHTTWGLPRNLSYIYVCVGTCVYYRVYYILSRRIKHGISME